MEHPDHVGMKQNQKQKNPNSEAGAETVNTDTLSNNSEQAIHIVQKHKSIIVSSKDQKVKHTMNNDNSKEMAWLVEGTNNTSRCLIP